MTTLQQALQQFTASPTYAPGVVHYSTPQWVEAPDFTWGSNLKKVFLYIEEDWNVSAGGGASMMADRRLRLSEVPLGNLDKSTRQCEGNCYCEEMDRDASRCSSGWFEETRWVLGTLLAPKGAKAPEIWRLVPDEVVQNYDRRKRSRDLHRWVEGMPNDY